MQLYHVSEDPTIQVFHPRLPTRADLDPTVGLVWAIADSHLPNFLTPRDCPRVAYHLAPHTTEVDRLRFGERYVVAIQRDWYDRLCRTALCLYEFDPAGFTLQDAAAGYYVSTGTEVPVGKHCVADLPRELARRGVELRVVDSLWELAEAVRGSSLYWSLCRMRNARGR